MKTFKEKFHLPKTVFAWPSSYKYLQCGQVRQFPERKKKSSFYILWSNYFNGYTQKIIILICIPKNSSLRYLESTETTLQLFALKKLHVRSLQSYCRIFSTPHFSLALILTRNESKTSLRKYFVCYGLSYVKIKLISFLLLTFFSHFCQCFIYFNAFYYSEEFAT